MEIMSAFKSIHCSPGLKLVLLRLVEDVGRYEDYLAFAQRRCCVYFFLGGGCVFVGFAI